MSPGAAPRTYEPPTTPRTPTKGEPAHRPSLTRSTPARSPIARLGRTLRRWHQAFLAYFTTDRANNGPTEAVNGIIELHRRLARGYRNRDDYRLRMLLAAGGLIT
jgi:transposase